MLNHFSLILVNILPLFVLKHRTILALMWMISINRNLVPLPSSEFGSYYNVSIGLLFKPFFTNFEAKVTLTGKCNV